MDVSPPAAVGANTRPSAYTDQRTDRPSATPIGREGRPRLTLRHVAIVLAGAGVVALGAVACVLSFEDLRALALAGRARPDLAYLYPAGFDALLAVALISVLLLRTGRALVRFQASAVLVLLLLAAGAAEVLTTLGLIVVPPVATAPADGIAIGVAVAPWVMLTIALWLWLLMIKHAQARREPAVRPAVEHDIVPFTPPGPPRHAGAPGALFEPAHAPVLAAPTPPDPANTANTVDTVEQVAPLPKREPGASPIPKPLPGGPEPEEEEPEARRPAVEPFAEPVVELDVEEPRDELPERAPDLPLRWGDLAKTLPRKRPGDVLVHPRPAASDAEADEAHEAHEVSERDQDTQPLRVFGAGDRRSRPQAEEPADEPADEVWDAHVAGAVANSSAHRDPAPEREEQDGEGRGSDSGPPSGRMRSTPVPPEE
ncbi:DUF2637 domain-containing protein [Spongiactinospora sp. TRM90649]|uniref:DUF2637 domain-containing protein n=1 Tax=Spongiactinospora sp. TRM90649 TaxID=3031114 RepID=UPI0023F7BDE5|nr:DUF2637 domain-containing protein [Spongiactinospora sp. TRM90649]MDF5751704.1 hypothetical protein [Spongiactinospora sp. TRM90649]